MRNFLATFVLLLLYASIYAKSGTPADSAINTFAREANDTVRMKRLYDYALSVEVTSPGSAVAVAKYLLEDARRKKNVHYEERANHALGNAYKRAKDFPRGLQYYLEAYRLQKQQKDYERQISTCFEIADLYDLADDLGKMKQYVEEAWKICQDHNVQSYKPHVLDRMATIDKKQGNLDTAIAKYGRAIELAKQQNDKYAQVASYCNMAIAMKSAKKYPESLDAYNEALGLIDTNEDKYAHCIILGNMANLFYEMGDMTRSKQYAYRSLALQPEVNEVSAYLDMYELLKKIYTAEKNYPLALDYFSKWVAIKDSVIDKEKSQQIQELQTKYDTRNKDEQIDAQRKELAYNRRINLFLTLSSVLLFAIVGIVYYNQRRTRKLNQLITNQKVQLEQLNGVKDRIFSVIGHDMRSPVNTLISFTHLLENKKVSPDELTEYSGLLRTNLQHTARLLENLLNWAKSQMEGYKPVLEYLDISTTAEQVAGLLAQDAAAKSILLENNVGDGAMVYADVNMTELLLRNLLSNAIKYTKENGRVILETEQAGDKLRIRVTDTGVGMRPDMVVAFNKGDLSPIGSTAGTSLEKGTGLGLMLSRNFMSLMNGTIWVESIPGKGTIVTSELPATAPGPLVDVA